MLMDGEKAPSLAYPILHGAHYSGGACGLGGVCTIRLDFWTELRWLEPFSLIPHGFFLSLYRTRINRFVFSFLSCVGPLPAQRQGDPPANEMVRGQIAQFPSMVTVQVLMVELLVACRDHQYV